MPDGALPAVVIAVPTFRRPATLATLLPLLVERAEALGARVLVVDNDPAGSAAAVVADFGGAVDRVHEPRPGISAARNRALDEAVGADVLVFIDDDELPGNGWPFELVSVWSRWRSAAVTGPVRSEFPPGADPWLAASNVLPRHHRTTGEKVFGAATNNLLIDLRQARELDLRFDERFGLTGGEDTMFAHLLIRRGGTIRWADNAEVLDPVPADRAKRRWMLRRTFRAGTTWSAVHLTLAATSRQRLVTRGQLVAKGGFRLVNGLAAALVGLVRRDLRRQAVGTCDAVAGAGMLLGACGFVLREYARR